MPRLGNTMNWRKYKEQKFISHSSRDLVVQVHGPCVWWALLLYASLHYKQAIEHADMERAGESVQGS